MDKSVLLLKSRVYIENSCVPVCLVYVNLYVWICVRACLCACVFVFGLSFLSMSPWDAVWLEE